ncbi:retrotransposon protein, putative, ty1-copia subclass [Tanacetum coccineum]|uniref:Retrotransposon protein, putative, ty1-copia subclass n=1 Tax=Tanacetum coccineum TaxID=301880 RepID=A0ABQ4X149_9ASTR
MLLKIKYPLITSIHVPRLSEHIAEFTLIFLDTGFLVNYLQKGGKWTGYKHLSDDVYKSANLLSSFYPVFDGHEGAEAASYVKEHAMRLFFESSDLPKTTTLDGSVDELGGLDNFRMATGSYGDCSMIDYRNSLTWILEALILTQLGTPYVTTFLDHLKKHGIIAHRTPPYTPQHNGVSERINRTLLDMVRSMMSQTTLPRSFWDYALESAACILNMVPTKKVEKTPYESYNSRSLDDLEVFQEEDTHPFENTSIHQDVGDQEIDEPQSDVIPIRRSTRTRHAPDQICLYIDDGEYELRDLNEPDNYKAALLDPEFDKWLEAMNVEMKSMKDNDV